LILTPPLEIVLTVNAIKGKVISMTLTAVRHKHHVKIMTSAPNFRG